MTKRCATSVPRLLSATEAQRTLVARLTPTVDRLRQRMTTFGLRPYQVFLVWTRWTGPERGEGSERVFMRTPILPTPKVEDLSSVSLQLFAAGVLPAGSIRVSEISGQYAQDTLSGLTVPPDPEADRASRAAGRGPVDPAGSSVATNNVVPPYEFFWEVVEDGRSNEGRPPRRARFRPASVPYRRAEKFDWTILLERVSDDMKRDGNPRTALAVPGGCIDDD